MEKCALYLIEDCQRGAVKIGISNDPDRRIREIVKTYNVSRVREIQRTWFDNRDEARGWESKFHQKYVTQQSSLQGGREWFDLSDEQVQGFIQWMEASTNGLSCLPSVETGSVLTTGAIARRNRFWGRRELELRAGLD